jgi:antagonist of KipI
MDPVSHRIANALVGNERGAAALEITLAGPEMEFDDQRIVAVSGAHFALTVDGRPQLMNTPFLVSAGSVLRFGDRSRGARAYLAIAGGVAVPEVLGSRSTHLLSRIGGFRGRALAGGDHLPLGSGQGKPRHLFEHHSLPDIPAPGGDVRIRVLPGPHRDRFGAGALEALQSAAYSIRTDSDRMGFRLQGPPLGDGGRAEIISDATPLGAVQVPASGDPVMLMADRQTTGGYPIIATAISADIGAAGQLAPGDRIRFDVCSMRDAMAAIIQLEQALMAIELAPPS